MTETYYDGFYVDASLIDAPWARSDKYLEALIELPGGTTADLNTLTEDVEDISLMDQNGTAQHPFCSDQFRHHGSWGADGSVLGYAIDIAVALGATGLYDGIQRLIRKCGQQRTSRGRNFTDVELIEHATRVMARKLGVHSDQLKPSGITRTNDPNICTVDFSGPDGLSSQVEIRIIEGIPVVVRHFRQIP